MITLLPYHRTGLAAQSEQKFSTKNTADPEVTLALSLSADGMTPVPVSHKVTLMGPGHVVGIPDNVVLRRSPAPGENEAPYNHMVQVEFSDAALPWRGAPYAPDDQGRLPPWLALIVVRATVATLEPASPCPRLKLTAAATELPDPAEGWAFSHVQNFDGLGSARMLCPRRLEPGTRYIAALVPRFLAGKQAGLGEAVTETTLAYAWTTETTEVVLPVYHSWNFKTIENGTGDFEDLAARIRTEAASDGIGRAQVQFTAQSPLLSEPLSGSFSFSGAIVGSPAAAPAVQNALGASIIATWKALAGPVPNGFEEDPVLALPIYGASQAGFAEDPRNAAANLVNHAWLAPLNLDPALRAAAGLGARLVEEHQENLVASAWAQLAGLREENQRRRQRQLALEVGRRMNRRIQKLPVEEQLYLHRPALAKIPPSAASRRQFSGTAPADLAAMLARTDLPPGTLSAEARRAARPGGPLGRRMSAAAPKSSAKNLPPTGRFCRAVKADAVAGKFGSKEKKAPNDVLNSVGEDLRTHMAGRKELMRKKDAPIPQTRAVNDGPLYAQPSFAEALAPLLAQISPEFLLPGAGALTNDRVYLLQGNQHFVAAILAGANDAIGRELRWREFPLDPKWTCFRHFWERPEPGSGDLKSPLSGWSAWPPALNGGTTALFLVKADLLARFPNSRVYVWNEGAKAPLEATYSGELAPGLQYFGFSKPESWDPCFFVLEQPPDSPRFGLDQGPETPAKAPAKAEDTTWEHLKVKCGEHLRLSETTASLMKALKLPLSPEGMARLCLQKRIRVVIPAKKWTVVQNTDSEKGR